ncbi:MAG: hypothetical protein KatS3mg027_2740 [Bacteroidia bacterium]|nr:MAG: hypothetical protein KatS3mg027_2740 [Bacteroidia bacterium]
MKQIKQAIIVICFITLFSSCGHHFYILGKVNQINDDKQKKRSLDRTKRHINAYY